MIIIVFAKEKLFYNWGNFSYQHPPNLFARACVRKYTCTHARDTAVDNFFILTFFFASVRYLNFVSSVVFALPRDCWGTSRSVTFLATSSPHSLGKNDEKVLSLPRKKSHYICKQTDSVIIGWIHGCWPM